MKHIAKGFGGGTALCVCLAMLAAAPAQAQTILPFNMELSNSPGSGTDPVFYDPDVGAGAFMINVATGDLNLGVQSADYVFLNCSFTLTEAEVISIPGGPEAPYAVFDDHYQGGPAILTIRGDIGQVGVGLIAQDALLVEAVVSGTFDVYEVNPGGSPDNVNFHGTQTLTMTGGEFLDGALTGLWMPEQFQAKYELDNVWSDDENTDFNGILGWAQPGTVVHFIPPPELGVSNLSWKTVDGGGGVSSGGLYGLVGVIGQPDASRSAGGGYVLRGGFFGSDKTTMPPICIVDLDDLTNLVSHWLEGGAVAANLNGDDRVDMADFGILVSYWLKYCPENWPWP